MPLNIRIQWNAGTACVSECVLKTLACRGLRVGPSKVEAEKNFFLRDFAGGQMSRDMTLFVDDDGTAYHITSAEENATTHIHQLTDDYLRPTGVWSRAFPKRWMEGHTICKRDGKYWHMASGCTGWKPNAARSAVADNILGPWTELDNPCAVGENPQTKLGADTTFGGQSTFILKVSEKDDCYIAMFDEWHPENAIDGRYYWLPMTFVDGRFVVEWRDEWSYV